MPTQRRESAARDLPSAAAWLDQRAGLAAAGSPPACPAWPVASRQTPPPNQD